MEISVRNLTVREKVAVFLVQGMSREIRFGTGQQQVIGCMWKDYGYGTGGILLPEWKFIRHDLSLHEERFLKKLRLILLINSLPVSTFLPVVMAEPLTTTGQ